MTIFIIIAIMFTIALIVIVGLVMPKKILVIHSEVIIDKPKDTVWNYVRLLRHQENYNTWIRQDPNIKMNYTGTDGTAGFIAAWESRTRMGDGEQEILQVNEGISYEAELRFRNHDNRTHVKTILESVEGNKTKVTTTISATPLFPMNLIVPVMKKILLKNMDQNSANLKRILES